MLLRFIALIGFLLAASLVAHGPSVVAQTIPGQGSLSNPAQPGVPVNRRATPGIPARPPAGVPQNRGLTAPSGIPRGATVSPGGVQPVRPGVPVNRNAPAAAYPAGVPVNPPRPSSAYGSGGAATTPGRIYRPGVPVNPPRPNAVDTPGDKAAPDPGAPLYAPGGTGRRTVETGAGKARPAPASPPPGAARCSLSQVFNPRLGRYETATVCQ